MTKFGKNMLFSILWQIKWVKSSKLIVLSELSTIPKVTFVVAPPGDLSGEICKSSAKLGYPQEKNRIF